MPILNIKSNHKFIKEYYNLLQKFDKFGAECELSVKRAFEDVLSSCCGQFNWVYIAEQSLKFNDKLIRPDGVIVRQDTLKHGFFEAKGNNSNLETEVRKKFGEKYPNNNILFWQPKRAILYQNGQLIWDDSLSNAENLCQVLKLFFEYSQPEIEQWDRAAAEFGSKVQELGKGLLDLIENEKKINKRFIDAFNNFTALCRQSINPNLAEKAIEEMLIQHLLTERIFRRLFDNPDFVKRNVIAVEIERVIDALTSNSFNRNTFLQGVDYFYKALEMAASTITEYQEKQDFLNTVYEKFFQGFAVKQADTHGIVYTPQPIVDFMVKSVEDILQREFNKSLSDKNVHILDPFVGTGNFILRIMQQLKKTALSYKYAEELHCNEVMLLPYYIASMNIEHEFYQITGNYKPFENICLVDTFLDQEAEQLNLFNPENTARVKKQRKSPIFVIIGNPPYNAGQINENDNNKNRKYAEIDQRVKETYAKDSKATLKKALSDPYVKAIRWASDRVGDEGLVALITNNSFINEISFDGMRKNLAKDFNKIYVLDLKGNVRKDSMREGIPIGEKHTIFGLGAMVGISISFFIKQKNSDEHSIFYSEVDWKATRLEKFELLEKAGISNNLDWKLLKPDQKNNWLTENLRDEFEEFIPLGDKKMKLGKFENCQSIFYQYSRGVMTGRDSYAYNFNQTELLNNINRLIDNYNYDLSRYKKHKQEITNIDNFVTNDETKISWSNILKGHFKREKDISLNSDCIRESIYRPYVKSWLYFDKYISDARCLFPKMLPTKKSEQENLIIAVTNHSQIPFVVQITNYIPCGDVGGRPTQCFPFYTYDETGENRQENITDWILKEYQNKYQKESQTITKWDIFYYIYAILHHPEYRKLYAENLKRELPRIPFAAEFFPLVKLGEKLANLHLNYENQPEHPLEIIENTIPPNPPLKGGSKGGSNLFRVEKMRLNKAKTELKYNDFLTLKNIPPEVFEYKLGNKSALEWVIDQYKIKTDKRSGIINDPNKLDDEQYILKLIGKIVTVSLETVKIVEKIGEISL